MRRPIAVLLALLALVEVASALAPAGETGLPRLSIQSDGVARNLAIVEAIVSVEYEGRVAEIVYELSYQNDTDRRQEGEFSLPLPPGSTVSTYAIDVRGAMRPAVSVERERARNAYESIKRQMVDPGIVEREAGNLYRTRVFPIEPRSAKRVRIGYLRELDPDRALELPLACEGRVGRFQLTVTDAVSPPALRGLTLPDPERPDKVTLRWTARDLPLSGALVVPPIPKTHRVERLRVEGAPDGVRHFAIQGELDPAAGSRPEAWKRVRVIWDASYSGRFRDQGGDLDALDQFWKWLGDAEVTAHLLNLELSQPFVCSLAGGDGNALRDYFSKIRYDGSADYSKITPFDGVTLLVGDGIVSSPLWAPAARTGGLFFLLKSAGDPASPELLAAIDAVLDRGPGDFLEVLDDHRDPLVIGGLPRGNWRIVRNGKRYRVTGVLPPGAPATLPLRGGGLKEREISTEPTHGTEEWNFTRRLWAQDRLSDLEWRRDRESIRRHAMAERLASDFTSLIVLERIEDHLRYEIPPPEPDLLPDYEEELSKRRASNSVGALAAWNAKRLWFSTEFPWIDTELREEAAAVALFAKAARSVFEPGEVERSTIPALEAWIPEATATASGAAKIGSDAAYSTWRAQAKARFEALRKIREDNRDRTPNRTFAVSVRGFVKERGVLGGESPFELRDAVARAGGPNSYGTLARVFLYRDGQRTGYNLESGQATPVPLRPCDMVVVESPPPLSYDGFADPFATAPGDPFLDPGPSAAGGAPVFEPAGQSRPHAARPPSPASSGGERRGTTEAAFVDGFAPPAATGIDAEFLDALRAAPDPSAFYRESLDGPFGDDPVAPATIVEAARFLFDKGAPDLANEALTTLCELEPNPVEAARALAFWLAELGQRERAAAILSDLLAHVPDKATKALVAHDLARLAGARDLLAGAVADDLESGEGESLAPLFLTDLFALGGRAPGAASSFSAQAMPSDLRVVVSCAGGGASLEVRPPDPPSLRDEPIKVAETGAWRLDHPRVLEYQVRRALPGVYAPSLVRWSEGGGPVTVRLDVYVRWGRKGEERRSATLLMDGSRLDLPKIDFGWGG